MTESERRRALALLFAPPDGISRVIYRSLVGHCGRALADAFCAWNALTVARYGAPSTAVSAAKIGNLAVYLDALWVET